MPTALNMHGRDGQYVACKMHKALNTATQHIEMFLKENPYQSPCAF